MYTKPLGEIISNHGLGHHFYADDTQVYLSFKPTCDMAQSDFIKHIEECVTDILTWMTNNMLKLNGER